jgi:hypothetical protein
MENNNPTEQTNENNKETIFTSEDFSLQGYDKHIRQARNAIFATAGIIFINLLILLYQNPGGYEYVWLDLLIWLAFIASFIVLGFWTKKKPYNAIISALVLYAIFIGLNAIIDVHTLYKGLLFKIFVIVYLIKGMGDAKEAQQMQEQVGK